MKYIQQFFNLVLMCMFLFSVKSNAEPKKKKPVFDLKLIGIQVSPDLCYHFLSNYYSEAQTRTFIKEQNQSDKPKLGWTCGITFNRNYSPKFGLSYGLYYSNKGYREVETFSPGSEGNLIKSKTSYRYHYIDFPFSILYNLDKEKSHFFLQAGISPSLHLAYGYKDTQEFIADPKFKNKELYFFDFTDFPPIVVSSLLGIGYNFSISEKLNFQVEPIYKYALNVNSFDIDGVGVHLWSLGCAFSCLYVLK